MKSVHDLLPLVTPYAGPCPEPVQRQQLRLAAGRFCADTEIWREVMDPVPSVAGQAAYPLTPPATHETAILRLLEVRVGGAAQDERGYALGADGKLHLATAPVKDDIEIVAAVVWLPMESCVDYPEWLMNRWEAGIAAGALAQLKLMAGQPWADPHGAGLHMSAYLDAVARAKSENLTGRKVDLRVPMRRFV